MKLRLLVFAIFVSCAVLHADAPMSSAATKAVPEDFFGAVGAITDARITVEPSTCRLGDPLKLTISIGGELYADRLRLPLLRNIEDIAVKFRVYDETARTVHENNRTEFRYIMRPRVTGTIDFPPLQITWFDIAERDYKTIFTSKVPIQVLPARIVKTPHAASADPRLIDKPDNADHRLPDALRSDDDGWKRLTWRDERIALRLAALGPAQYLAAVVFIVALRGGKTFRQHWRHLVAGLALRRQLRRWARVKAASPTETARAVWKAVYDFFSARLDIPPGCNTPRELWKAAVERSPRAMASDVCRDILESCHHQCYTQHPVKPFHASADNEILLRELPLLLPSRGFPPRKQGEGSFACAKKTIISKMAPTALTALLILAGLTLIPQSAPPSQYKERVYQHIWEEANTLAETASSSTEYAAARQRYRLLKAAGAHNAALFYNYGTLCLKSGNAGSALASLKRAERIEGSRRADLRHNLRTALRKHMTDTPHPAISDRIRDAGFNPVRFSLAFRLRLAALFFSAGWVVLSRQHLKQAQETKNPINL